MRLRRADPSAPGYRRRRSGRGFSYRDQDGRPIDDPEVIERLRSLVIPPAWADVWISPDPRGHIQATGIDAAGRKQYLYHPAWRARRDDAKFDHVLAVAERLPRLRRRIHRDLRGRGLSRQRVLAAVIALLDLGMFRVGGDEYATGEDATFGLATLRPEHVRGRSGCVVLRFPAKGGIEEAREVADEAVCAVLRDLRRRRKDVERLFGYWAGGSWHDVRAGEINEYLREVTGCELTAKDFRTWHATVVAAMELAGAGWHESETKRKRVVAAAMRAAAELLGDTPTVARKSYVDPRVVDRYQEGQVAQVRAGASQQALERAVLDLLSDPSG